MVIFVSVGDLTLIGTAELIAENLRTLFYRNNNALQRPKEAIHEIVKNLGSPKVKKGRIPYNHGDRELVLGSMLPKGKRSTLFSYVGVSQGRLFRTVNESIFYTNPDSAKETGRLYGTSSKPGHPKEFSEILKNGSPFMKPEKGGENSVKFAVLDPAKLINVIGHPVALLLAYEQIKSKKGNMTPGLDDETPDGVSFQTILGYSKKLKAGTFKFNLARRVMIPKSGKISERPLTIASPRVKIVQKAMQLVLTELYASLYQITLEDLVTYKDLT